MPLQAINQRALQVRSVDTDVEVLTAGRWHPGVLAEWRRYEAHGWVGWVRYSTGLATQRIGIFPADQVRERCQTDRRPGAEGAQPHVDRRFPGA